MPRPKKTRAVARLEGLEARQLLAGATDPVINEFLASNTTSIVDDYNLRVDWIEIHNPTPAPINLTNWHLTDTKGTPAKWTFPAGTSIAAGGYLVVFADGRPNSVGPGGRLHANFSLDSDGEYLGLTRPDNSVASEFDPFPSQQSNVSYGLGAPTVNNNTTLLGSGPTGAASLILVPSQAADLPANWNAFDFDDTAWTFTGQSGIGYDNDSGPTSYDSILQTDLTAQMSGAGRNTSAFTRTQFDVTGLVTDFQTLKLRMRYDDGFVAYLNGVKIAEANAPATQAWDSAATGNVVKDAGFVEIDVSQYLSALRAGKNVLAVQGLNDSNASPDFLMMPEIVGRRVTFGPEQYMTTLTPGVLNAVGALGKVKDTEFSVERALYTAPFQLVIDSDTPGASIRYTTDGSTPSATSGTVYAGPITVDRTMTVRAIAHKAGFLSTNVDAHSYIFPAQVINQTGAGLPLFYNWGHAGVDWAMDPDIVNGQQQAVINGLKSLPSVSLSTPWNEFFNPNGTGLYVSNDNRVDHPTSFEFIDNTGRDGVHSTAAIQLQGGSSDITWRNDKLSIDVKFQEAFGDSKLDYDIFGPGSGATDKFDHLILDAVFNQGWTYNGGSSPANQRGDAKYIQDQYISDLVNAAGGVSPHGRFVNLYLEGLYWGMYYLHEKPDDAFAAAYQGGEKEDYDVMKHNTSQVVAGSSTNYNALLNLARQPNMASDAVYQAVLAKLDVVDFIDYMIANFYGGNTDWAHQNWYASFNRVDPNGRWRFHSWDAEHVLHNGSDAISGALGTNVVGKSDSGGPTEINTLLRANADYRQLFADRVQKLMYTPGGEFTPTGMAAKWQARVNEVDAAMLAESARWGDNINPTVPYTQAGWRSDMTSLIAGYFPFRGDTLLSQLKNVSATTPLYPRLTNAPTFSAYGGTFAAPTSVTITTGGQAGTLYYRTDGLDPRLPGGALRPGTLTGANGVVVGLPASALVRARILNGTEWSALVEGTFLIGNPPALRVSEIMYHPAPPSGASTYIADDFEFIELKNTGTTAIDPSGFRFSNGVTFTFPDGSAAIPAGGRVVLVRNPAAFASRYPGVAVAGTFTGELDDSGERLTFETRLGHLITSFAYDDDWYGATDGDGYSLTALDAAATDAVLSTAAGWRASQPANGTPGTAADDPFNYLTRNAVVINEVLSNAAGQDATNWVELRNTTGAPIAVGGWWLSDDAVDRKRWQIPAGTMIPANGYVSFAQTGGFGGAFKLTSLGADLYLTSNDGAGGEGGYRDHVDFGGSDPNVSFGRYVKSNGAADFTAQGVTTRGAVNAAPLVGPIVINEIMYNPGLAGSAKEYVELRNVTDAAVSLAGWQISDGVAFNFAAADSIPANGYALVVPIDPALFRSTYNIPANVAIFGPYTGQLNNGGEKLTLSKAGAPVGSITPLVTVDRVNYDNELPWPAPPAGTGPSLGRVNAVGYGNDPANWRPDAAAGTAGVANALPPLVFAGKFDYLGSPAVTVKFSKDVGASLGGPSIVVANLTTGQTLPSDQVVRAYDPATQTATWQLPKNLADGNYRATLVASAIADAQGRQLDGNGDAAGGDDATVDFFHFAADANHDRTVDFNDLVPLAQNYNTVGGKTFAEGDFDFDGNVDFNDLVLLAQRYNTSLPQAGAAAVPARVTVTVAELAKAIGVAAPAVTAVTNPPAAPAAPTNAAPVRPPGTAKKPAPAVRPPAVITRPVLAIAPAPKLKAPTFAKKRITPVW